MAEDRWRAEKDAPSGSTTGALATEGPYVAFITIKGSANYANLLDVYGDGMVTYPLPSDSAAHIKYDFVPVDLVSPTGTYFVYYAGSEDRPYDLELRIIRLQDGQLIQAVPLLAKGMDTALGTLAEQAMAEDPEAFFGIPDELVPDELLFSLQTGIRAHAWSPAVDTFAFASQADGPSSDLYTIHAPSGATLRLTSGPQNIQRMSWSPNGRWIAHGAAFTSAVGAAISNFIISRDGSTLLDLPKGGLIEGGWVTSDWYFVYEAGHGSGDNSLKAVHLPDDHYLPAWEGPFTSYAFDVANEALAVSLYGPDVSGTGTYISTPRGEILEELETPVYGLVPWGRGPDRYAGSADTGVFSITLDGVARDIFGEPRRISVSPNKERLVLFDPQGEGSTVLYSAGSGELLDVINDDVGCVLWAPESDAFYLTSSHELYRYDLAVRELALIADGLVETSFPACGIRLVANE